MSKQIQQIFEKTSKLFVKCEKLVSILMQCRFPPRVFAPNWDCESCDSSPAQSIIAADPPAAYGTLQTA